MDNDELVGVFAAIDNASSAHDPIEQVNSEPKAEGAESGSSTEEAQETETKTSEQSPETKSSEEQKTEDVETPKTDQAPKAEDSTEAKTTETKEPLQTETKTDAEVKVEVDENWQATLPPAPLPYGGPVPEVDKETGQITNMTPEQYSTYLRESTKAEIRQESYRNFVETRGLDFAEKVLPEIKTNQLVRSLVENARVASIVNGKPIDVVTAAKQVKEALGLAPERIAQAKAEGAKNAKTSIEIQKRSAIETGSTQKSDDTYDKVTDLQKRIKRGDDEAFVELLGFWEETGKL